jgi:hypothetical protein
MLGAVWKRWNWLEDGIIPLAASLMYASWVYPLFALFLHNTVTGERNPGFTFGLCLAVLLGGVIAGKVASQNSLGIVIVVVGGLAAIWIALLLTVPPGTQDTNLWLSSILDRLKNGVEGEPVPTPFIVGLCVILLWWRGIRIASEDHGETVGSFVAGVVALIGLLFLSVVLPSSVAETSSKVVQSLGAAFGPLVFLGSFFGAVLLAVLSRSLGERAMILSQLLLTIGLLFLATILPVGPSAEELGGWLLLFLASGLATLALHGVQHALNEQARRTGIRLRVDRYWTITVLTVVAIVLGLGLIIGQIVAPGTLAGAFSLLKPIWTTLTQILLLLLYALAYLFFGLFEPLLAGIQNRPPRPAPRPFESPLGPEAIEELGREPIQVPPLLGQFIQAVLILGAIALVAWFFVRAVKKQKRKVLVQNDIIETRETILSLDLVRSQLRGLFDGLRGGKALPLFLDPGAPGDPRRTVRELYQRLLARGIEQNVPRAAEETPSVYQQTLSYLCEDERESLETLTLAYEVARYGITPPTPGQVQAAQDAFAHIDAALQARSTGVGGSS